MDSGYLKQGPDRAREVRRLFSDIAGKYDLANDIQSLGLHRIWKRQMAVKASSRGGKLGADICSGTGDVAKELSRIGVQVLAIDFALPMLISAGSFYKPTSPPRFQNIQADALALPLKNQSVDLVTMAYGLRNLSSVDRGISEMCRIAKSNAVLCILEFGKPENILWRWFYFNYLKLGLPLVGLCLAGNRAAYAYIIDSLKIYPSTQEISDKLLLNGCSSIQVNPIMGGAMTLHTAIKA